MTVEDVAAYLKMRTWSVYRMAQRGDIPAGRCGDNGSYRFFRNEIDDWLRESAASRVAARKAKKARTRKPSPRKRIPKSSPRVQEIAHDPALD